MKKSIENYCDESSCFISFSRAKSRWIMGQREVRLRKIRALSKPLPGNSFIEDLKFYSKKETIKIKTGLAINYLEEKNPLIYKTLVYLGMPKNPYS